MPGSPRTSSSTRATSTPRSSEPNDDVALLPSANGTSPLDNALGYEIAKQVNVPQLQAELAAASVLDDDVVNVAITGDPQDVDSQDLWVIPASISAQLVANVVAAHEPDPSWGVPNAIQEFNEALVRLRSNPDGKLTAADRDALIKGIAINFTALMPTPSS